MSLDGNDENKPVNVLRRSPRRLSSKENHKDSFLSVDIDKEEDHNLPFHRINDRLDNRRETFEGGSSGLNDLLNSSNFSIKTKKSPGRRLTADVADIESLWNELNESSVSIKSIDPSIISTKKRKSSSSLKKTLHETNSINENQSGNTFDLTYSTDNTENMEDLFTIPPKRRMTADMSDIVSLLNEIEDSSDDKSIASTKLSIKSNKKPTSESRSIFSHSLLNLFSPVSTSERRETVNGSALDIVMNHLDDSMESNDVSTVSKSSIKSRKSIESQNTSDSFEFDRSGLRNSRRQTVDPEDIKDMLRELEDGDDDNNNNNSQSVNQTNISTNSRSGKKNDSRRKSLRSSIGSTISTKSIKSTRSMNQSRAMSDYNNRRIDEDSRNDKLTGFLSNTSSLSNQSSYDRKGNMTGRESIDTVEPMNSVDNILETDVIEISKPSPILMRESEEVSDLIDLNDSMNHSDGEEDNHIKNSMNTSTDTVNTTDLMINIKDALGDRYMTTTMDDSSSTTQSYDFINQLEENMFISPSTNPHITESNHVNQVTASNTMLASALKSILSSKKSKVASSSNNSNRNNLRLSIAPSSVRKSVVFGSPAAAEFHKTSPITNFTPLDKEQAKYYFPQHFSVDKDIINKFSSNNGKGNNKEDEEEDEITAENSQILDQWDRLTNASGGSDDSDELYYLETEEGRSENSKKRANMRKSLDSNSSKRLKRRKSMGFSPLSRTHPKNNSSNHENDDNDDDGNNSNDISAIENMEEDNFTVGLPGNLMELMAQTVPNKLTNTSIPTEGVDNDSRISMNTSQLSSMDDVTEECTQALESSLHMLMRHIDYDHHSILLYDSDVNTSSDSNLSHSKNSKETSMVSSKSSTSLEQSLGPLLGIPSSSNIVPIYSSEDMNDGKNDGNNDEESLETSTISDASYASRSSSRLSPSLKLSISLGKLESSHLTDESSDNTVELEGKLDDLLIKSMIQGAAERRLSSMTEEGSEEHEENNDYNERLEYNMVDLMSQSIDSEAQIETKIADETETESNIYLKSKSMISNMVVIDCVEGSASLSSTQKASSSSYNNDTLSSQSSPTIHSTNKISFITTTLHNRLKALNDGARKSMLDHCSKTPLPSHKSKSRASVGFTLQKSIAGTQSLTSSQELLISSQDTQLSQSIVDTIEMKKTSGLEQIKGSIPAIVKNCDENANKNQDITFKDILSKAKLLISSDLRHPMTTMHYSLPILMETALSYHNSDSNDNLAIIFSEISTAATLEVGNQLQSTYSDDKIATIWDVFVDSITSGKTNIMQVDDMEGIEDMIKILRPQIEELVHFNWILWESTLCDTATESVKRQSEKLRKELDMIRTANDELEQSTILFSQSNADSNNVTSSIIPCENKNTERSMIETIFIKEKEKVEIDDQIKKLDIIKSVESSLYETQRSIQLMNRLIYCKIKELSTSIIDVEAIFSSTFRVSIQFSLNKSTESIDKIEVDINHIDQDSNEDMVARSYFAQIMANDNLSGPLSFKVLSNIEKIFEIPIILRKISGSIAIYKKVVSWISASAAKQDCQWTISSPNISFVSKGIVHSTISLREVVSSVSL